MTAERSENSINSKSVVILGVTSAIARATANAFARNGYAVIVGARDEEENARLATDIHVRYEVPSYAIPFDAMDMDAHASFPDACAEALGHTPTGLVLCFGYMAEQEIAEKNIAETQKMIDVNLTGAISILEQFATRFEERQSGFMGVLSSVAGDRGKQTNYIYGASKAGLTCYLQGLRVRLFKANVTVTTVQPGFVDTNMTYGLPLPGPLVATPEKAGNEIYKAVIRGKNDVYVPFFWRYIMMIIRWVPEWQFKKMSM